MLSLSTCVIPSCEHVSKPGPESVCVCVCVWVCVGVCVYGGVGVWGCVHERVIKRVLSLSTCVSTKHVCKP